MPFPSVSTATFLDLEQLDTYLFRGKTPLPSYPRIFGGQVLAQAMNAAMQTVDSARLVHSLHGYFLRPGDPQKAIVFEVDAIRDGGSFTTRRIVAKQNNKTIYNCGVSFMLPGEGVSHQTPLQANKTPEQINQLESLEQFNTRIMDIYPDKFVPEINIFNEWDVRQRHWGDPFAPEELAPCKEFWMKYKVPLDADAAAHQTLLAYISDIGLMGTAFLPHKKSLLDNDIQIASLDHAMWFHQPCNINDWLCYQCESPWAGSGRGLNFGKLYNQKGLLLASTAQEGLMRAR